MTLDKCGMTLSVLGPAGFYNDIGHLPRHESHPLFLFKLKHPDVRGVTDRYNIRPDDRCPFSHTPDSIDFEVTSNQSNIIIGSILFDPNIPAAHARSQIVNISASNPMDSGLAPVPAELSHGDGIGTEALRMLFIVACLRSAFMCWRVAVIKPSGQARTQAAHVFPIKKLSRVPSVSHFTEGGPLKGSDETGSTTGKSAPGTQTVVVHAPTTVNNSMVVQFSLGPGIVVMSGPVAPQQVKPDPSADTEQEKAGMTALVAASVQRSKSQSVSAEQQVLHEEAAAASTLSSIRSLTSAFNAVDEDDEPDEGQWMDVKRMTLFPTKLEEWEALRLPPSSASSTCMFELTKRADGFVITNLAMWSHAGGERAGACTAGSSVEVEEDSDYESASILLGEQRLQNCNWREIQTRRKRKGGAVPVSETSVRKRERVLRQLRSDKAAYDATVALTTAQLTRAHRSAALRHLDPYCAFWKPALPLPPHVRKPVPPPSPTPSPPRPVPAARVAMPLPATRSMGMGPPRPAAPPVASLGGPPRPGPRPGPLPLPQPPMPVQAGQNMVRPPAPGSLQAKPGGPPRPPMPSINNSGCAGAGQVRPAGPRPGLPSNKPPASSCVTVAPVEPGKPIPVIDSALAAELRAMFAKPTVGKFSTGNSQGGAPEGGSPTSKGQEQRFNAETAIEGGSAKGKPMARTSLIDGRRAQNIAIALAKLKALLPEGLRAALLSVCPSGLAPSGKPYTVSLPQAQLLQDVMPTGEESTAVTVWANAQTDPFAQAKHRLAEADQFFVSLYDVPQAAGKARALLYRLSFATRVQEVEKRVALITQATVELQAKEGALRKLLEAARTAATQAGALTAITGGKHAFSLVHLPLLKTFRLPSMAARDPRGTLLHWLAAYLDKTDSATADEVCPSAEVQSPPANARHSWKQTSSSGTPPPRPALTMFPACAALGACREDVGALAGDLAALESGLKHLAQAAGLSQAARADQACDVTSSVDSAPPAVAHAAMAAVLEKARVGYAAGMAAADALLHRVHGAYAYGAMPMEAVACALGEFTATFTIARAQSRELAMAAQAQSQ